MILKGVYMSGSIIWDGNGDIVGKSRNLRGILDGARLYGGVKKVEVTKDGVWGALVSVTYANGYIGVVDFVCMSHAIDWARMKSNKKGWWKGCEVVVVSYIK
jgi:hypothetical protein